MSRLLPALPLADLTENEWDAQLFRGPGALARTLGWTLVYHTLRSKGSQPGFPDRVLVRDRIVFAELKTEKGKPTEPQVEWLTGIAKAGAEVYLWRPSDLDEIARVLGKRWSFFPHDSSGALATPALAAADVVWWQPRSLWLPSGRRADEAQQT